MDKTERTNHFRQKNERRKAHRDDPGAEGAADLRKVGLLRKVKTTVPTDFGEDLVIEDEITGVPGAFGWATKHEWNERIPGTSGETR
jgi:hypothetical protein